MKKTAVRIFLFQIPLFLLSLLSSINLWASGNGAGITYQGLLLSPSGDPVVSSSVQFRIQIRTPSAENCLMYEEIQIKDLSTSNGIFSLTINDGSGTRLDGTGLALDQVFANRGTFTFSAGNCTVGSNFSPNATDSRKIQILFNDGTLPANQWETIPSMAINFAPTAIEALQIGGYKKEQLVKIADGVNTTNTELTNTDWTNLLALFKGTSSQYPSQNSFNTLNSSVTTLSSSMNSLNTSVQIFAKTALPTCTGSQALSSSDGTTLGCVSVATTVSSGSTAGALLSTDWTNFNNKQPAGNYATALSGDITSGSFSAGTLVTTISSNVITNANISNSASIADSKLATITTAGKVSGAAITSGDISTTGNFTSTGSVSVSGNVSSSGNLMLYDSSTATTKIAIQAPSSGITDYILRLPAAIGSANQTLSITSIAGGVATLGWSNPSSGSVTSVTAATTAGNPISVAGTATAPTIDLPAATGSVNGYLSATDWTTFNNKQAAGNYITALTGDITASGPGSAVASIAANAVTTSKINDAAVTTAKINDNAVTSAKINNGAVTTVKALSSNPGISRLIATDASTGANLTNLDCTIFGQVLSWVNGTGWTCKAISEIYTAPVTSVAGKTGAVTLASADITDATNANTASTLVKRDSSGNFSVGTVTSSSLVTSSLQVTGGSLTAGNVLTSDGSGNAIWQSPSSQWVTSGSNISYSGGNVGIGTTSPTALFSIGSLSTFQVNGSGNITDLGGSLSLLSGTAGYPSVKLAPSLSGSPALSFAQGNSAALDTRLYRSAAKALIVDDTVGGAASFSVTGSVNLATVSGNVGIGTTSPTSALTVNGSIVSSTPTDNTTTTIDFSKGNAQSTSAALTSGGTTNFTLNNMQDGGVYALIVTSTTNTTFSFSATGLTLTAGSTSLTTTGSSKCLFTFVRIGSIVYITFVQGF